MCRQVRSDQIRMWNQQTLSSRSPMKNARNLLLFLASTVPDVVDKRSSARGLCRQEVN